MNIKQILVLNSPFVKSLSINVCVSPHLVADWLNWCLCTSTCQIRKHCALLCSGCRLAARVPERQGIHCRLRVSGWCTQGHHDLGTLAILPNHQLKQFGAPGVLAPWMFGGELIPARPFVISRGSFTGFMTGCQRVHILYHIDIYFRFLESSISCVAFFQIFTSTGYFFLFQPNGYVFESMNLEVFDRRPVASNDLVAQQVIAYTRGCLDALHITNGATYTEALFQKLWKLWNGKIPPWKINIAPENIPSQKESSLPTIIFQGLC